MVILILFLILLLLLLLDTEKQRKECVGGRIKITIKIKKYVYNKLNNKNIIRNQNRDHQKPVKR